MDAILLLIGAVAVTAALWALLMEGPDEER